VHCYGTGKLTVLRMCNSLLRKLSKSCNTEVRVVEVLLFLLPEVTVFPIILALLFSSAAGY
jgi:hypothetical protein